MPGKEGICLELDHSVTESPDINHGSRENQQRGFCPCDCARRGRPRCLNSPRGYADEDKVMDLEGSEGSPGLGTVCNGQQNNVAPEDDLPIHQNEPEGDLPQVPSNIIPLEANVSAIYV
ncbi:hypothetical protein PV11_05298 [Exophiala sideris]|uniref:Uncharacterized protein n=1 Tax=Exophiala sideris TaxID=1016849 RepID=A0A0D1Z909_9EURO|nr:hypothetical protein PV11_05298 [Exophiala sideris]